nr:PQ-loop domain-containing transporter [Paenibacillus sp. 79R4]
MQLIGGVILAIGWIPQILQIIKTKSVRDLSLKSYLFMLSGIALMEIYAIDLVSNGAGIAFLMTNSLSLLVVLFVIMLVLRYRK